MVAFVKMCQYAGLLSHANDTLSPTILCLPKHCSSSHIKHLQFIPSGEKERHKYFQFKRLSFEQIYTAHAICGPRRFLRQIRMCACVCMPLALVDLVVWNHSQTQRQSHAITVEDGIKCRRQKSALIVHLNDIKHGPRPFVAIKITWCNHFKVSHKLMRAWAKKKPLILSMCEYRCLSSSTPPPSSLSSSTSIVKLLFGFHRFYLIYWLFWWCYFTTTLFAHFEQFANKISVCQWKSWRDQNLKLILKRVSFSFYRNNWDRKSNL